MQTQDNRTMDTLTTATKESVYGRKKKSKNSKRYGAVPAVDAAFHAAPLTKKLSRSKRYA